MRPLVFLSHSAQDAAIVGGLRSWISDALSSGVDFFQSSDSRSLSPGSSWFKDIVAALGSCRIVLVVVTPNMLRSSWAFFEAGAAHLRGIDVVPVCGFGIPIEALPSPINQLTAVDIATADGQERLIGFLSGATGLTLPRQPPHLDVPIAPRLDGISNLHIDPVFAGFASHPQILDTFMSNIKSAGSSLREILMSGASLTDFIHVGTNRFIEAARGPSFEKISIVIKHEDPTWCDLTYRGMAFDDPYDASDSLAMLTQARRDVSVMQARLQQEGLDLCDARTCAWPPTYSMGYLRSEQHIFAFVEPFVYGQQISDRTAIVLVEGADAAPRSPTIDLLVKGHERLVIDSVPIT